MKAHHRLPAGQPGEAFRGLPDFGQKKARQGRAFLVLLVSLVARAALAGLRFVDLQGATLAVGAVQGLDVPILDDVGRGDLTILGKHGVQIRIRGRPGQISNIDVLRQKNNSKEKKGIEELQS